MAVYKHNSDDLSKGKVVYNVSIVKGIVSLAVEDVEGVAIQNKKKAVKKSSDSIKVEVCANGAINVSVNVSIYYGYSIPDVAYNIQRNVKHSVESMSKYKIGNIDVKVNGVIFPEETAVGD